MARTRCRWACVGEKKNTGKWIKNANPQTI